MSKQDSRILKYLEQFAKGDQRVFELLVTSVGRVLSKNARRDKNWHSLCIPNEINHIVNWLSVSIKDSASWLSNVDHLGRPKKLLKFCSIDQITAEANKASKIANEKIGKVTLIDGDEELFAELSDGFYLVKLLTPAALDRESSVMQHCIGHGDFDDSLDKKEFSFLSLRDRHGNPHVTLEIHRPYEVLFVEQMQGKQNKCPNQEYLNVLIPYLEREKIVFGHVFLYDQKVRDVNNVLHSISNLPQGFESVDDIDWFKSDEGYSKTLPSNMKVNGSLYLVSSEVVALPENLQVTEDLHIFGTRITHLPKSIRVEGDINADNSSLAVIDDGFTCRGDLKISGTRLKSLPKNLIVAGALDISETEIDEVPECCKIGTKLIVDEYQLDTLTLPECVAETIELEVMPSKHQDITATSNLKVSP
jgi:hypothetical protein